jgi:preprotein translocase subunit SecD
MRLYNPVSIRLSGGNMKIRLWRFNTYLLAALALAGTVGCETASPEQKSEKKKAREEAKQLSTLRVHLQVQPEEAMGQTPVPVFRESPVWLHIQRTPILTEVHVQSAKVLEVMGTLAIEVEFNHAGLFLLEQFTTTNKGRRLVIFSQFGETKDQARWLAAPLIKERMTQGSLTFTPDATREEAERIVRGLNNAVAKSKKNSWM